MSKCSQDFIIKHVVVVVVVVVVVPNTCQQFDKL